MARFWTTVLYKTVHSTPVKIFQLNTAPIAYFKGVGNTQEEHKKIEQKCSEKTKNVPKRYILQIRFFFSAFKH